MNPTLPSRQELESRIHDCNACPRLRSHCASIAETKRRAYQAETYWGKPITPFGPTSARLVIVGLAPGAHGANRTGRVFTGDRSGEWLYRALFRAGFANQPESLRRDDTLALNDAVITCVVKCAPPDNKPAPEELARCTRLFFETELELFNQAQVYLALGKIAWDALIHAFQLPKPRPSFAHGREVMLAKNPLFSNTKARPALLLGSYHPSQQNTFTGRLTEPLFDAIFLRARQAIADP
ncbi:MAG: hypothetical protein RJB38_1310 [Pseudomonadota bacterium]|jgi:uracil-DNA glycosylase family 4